MRTGEGSCGDGTSLEATLPEVSIIVISDDESDVSALGNSVLLIEDTPESFFTPEKRKLEVLDDELAITYSKKPHVMPHARYDCTLHPFTRVEQETDVPLEENSSSCGECYCYLCDKLASECSSWTCPSDCHCNAHNKSKYWKERRDMALAGILTIFKLDLTEIDTELREGGNQLNNFLLELSPVQQKYRDGTFMMLDNKCLCACHRDKKPKCNLCIMVHKPMRVHSYLPVYELVTEFLNKAEHEHPRTAAVMLLGAAREILMEKILMNPVQFYDASTSIIESSVALMSRIVATLQRLLVLEDYPRNLYEKFIIFFQSIPLPRHCCNFLNSLNIFRWDNLFLTSVLAGQNLSGSRVVKGKRENLCEPLPVVQSRVKKMEMDQSYRQLVRYLTAVKCPDQAGLFCLKQKMAFYMCKFGNFAQAALFLLQTKGMQCSVASILTPDQYELYLTMLHTNSCPPGKEPVAGEVWIPCEGPPLKAGVFLRIALRILLCNNAFIHEVRCWSTVVRIWSTSDCLSKDGKLMPRVIPEPDKDFQMMLLDMSCPILDELQRHNMPNLPPPFHQPHRVSAEFIMIVQAVTRFMLSAALPLPPMLELVFAFGSNLWALELLIQNIMPMNSLLLAFMTNIQKEMNDNEQQVLNTLDYRGGVFAANFISVFLLHGCGPVQIFGHRMIDMLIKNVTRFNWTADVGYALKSKVCSTKSRLYIYNETQMKLLLTKLGCLTGKK
ncbi:uncharacterized protein LOC120943248 [Rana temporaria]|uniref:uncharacterized protein LOC120943248 n=1 Tax=Rana temporaria TaxID=8407 RepID=UPI001AAC88E8|nr:uncharacterized protein LOC120943248 [Rana temporaria]